MGLGRVEWVANGLSGSPGRYGRFAISGSAVRQGCILVKGVVNVYCVVILRCIVYIVQCGDKYRG